MKNRLLKPENKNIMVQEIKKEVKPFILKKLSEKKASITRNGETGKLNKESSLDNERYRNNKCQCGSIKSKTLRYCYSSMCAGQITDLEVGLNAGRSQV